MYELIIALIDNGFMKRGGGEEFSEEQFAAEAAILRETLATCGVEPASIYRVIEGFCNPVVVSRLVRLKDPRRRVVKVFAVIRNELAKLPDLNEIVESWLVARRARRALRDEEMPS